MASTFLLITFVIYHLISTVGLTMDPFDLLRLSIDGQISVDGAEVQAASVDFGGMSQVKPLAVLHPASADDVVSLVRAASGGGFSVSARGHGHSINGQAQVGNGVVIDMSGPKGRDLRARNYEPILGSVTSGGKSSSISDGVTSGEKSSSSNAYSTQYYVDVWGGELWIDVLKWTLERGLAPKSWTDYLYLSVGGTLSNAGISGQAFNHGPQISNVYELDVVTGKGELLTCSREENPELFHGVLGGLGQFGIITRARIALEPAPQRVKWIRVLYSNFSAFTEDQEYLISLHGAPASDRFDYVEGFIIVDEGLINNWRSSFFSPRNPVNLSSLTFGSNSSVLYCLEIAKNYNESTSDTVDQEVEALLKKLDFIPSSMFTTDVTYVDFLDRVHKAELKLRAKGLWEVPHPWLNLFVPKSRIAEFNEGVFKSMLVKNKTSGPILVYPMNKNKWDQNSSVVTPDEDIFYLVALLRSAVDDGKESHSLDYLRNQNRRILRFCQEAGIEVKHYLPNYSTQEQWISHFGEKWEMFVKKKIKFDPNHVLAVGQRIFQPYFTASHAFSW